MTCLRLSGSASASLRRMASSCWPALYMVSLARMSLMATRGLLPSASCRSLSSAVTTLENTPLPLALTTSYLCAPLRLVPCTDAGVCTMIGLPHTGRRNMDLQVAHRPAMTSPTRKL